MSVSGEYRLHDVVFHENEWRIEYRVKENAIQQYFARTTSLEIRLSHRHSYKLDGRLGWISIRRYDASLPCQHVAVTQAPGQAGESLTERQEGLQDPAPGTHDSRQWVRPAVEESQTQSRSNFTARNIAGKPFWDPTWTGQIKRKDFVYLAVVHPKLAKYFSSLFFFLKVGNLIWFVNTEEKINQI